MQTFDTPEGFELNQVLERYTIGYAHNLVYTFDELKKLDLNPEFIYTLLDVFTNDKSFRAEMFNQFSLEIILDYIRKTHTYYLTKKLPEIEQSICLLLSNYPNAHPLLIILKTFYKEYRNALSNHITHEEVTLLPYIHYLIKCSAGKESTTNFNYSSKHTLQQFLEEHHDTEKDLIDIRQTILQYQPPVTNQTPYRILLSQLHVLEKDLAVHALIEDHVLVPRSKILEMTLKEA